MLLEVCGHWEEGREVAGGVRERRSQGGGSQVGGSQVGGREGVLLEERRERGRLRNHRVGYETVFTMRAKTER